MHRPWHLGNIGGTEYRTSDPKWEFFWGKGNSILLPLFLPPLSAIFLNSILVNKLCIRYIFILCKYIFLYLGNIGRGGSISLSPPYMFWKGGSPSNINDTILLLIKKWLSSFFIYHVLYSSLPMYYNLLSFYTKLRSPPIFLKYWSPVFIWSNWWESGCLKEFVDEYWHRDEKWVSKGACTNDGIFLEWRRCVDQ